MSEITRGAIVRVGVDLAKLVIQVHAVDAAGRRVVSRAFKRDQFIAWCALLPAGCVVAMEACASAHHWARRLRAMGLDAKLIAASFVSPYRMEGFGNPARLTRLDARTKMVTFGGSHADDLDTQEYSRRCLSATEGLCGCAPP